MRVLLHVTQRGARCFWVFTKWRERITPHRPMYTVFHEVTHGIRHFVKTWNDRFLICLVFTKWRFCLYVWYSFTLCTYIHKHTVTCHLRFQLSNKVKINDFWGWKNIETAILKLYQRQSAISRNAVLPLRGQIRQFVKTATKSSATQTSYAATPHTAGGMKMRVVWTAGVWYND